MARTGPASIVLTALAVVFSGCSGLFGGNSEKDVFRVEIVTNYKTRGYEGEPAAGSPCKGCSVTLSIGPAEQQFGPRPTGGTTGTAGNGSINDDGGGSGGCEIPRGQSGVSLRPGATTHPEGCSYLATLDGEGRIAFATPKNPTMFLMIKFLDGKVQQTVSGCNRPSYYARGPELNVTNDQEIKLNFTLSCFRGD